MIYSVNRNFTASTTTALRPDPRTDFRPLAGSPPALSGGGKDGKRVVFNLFHHLFEIVVSMSFLGKTNLQTFYFIFHMP